MPWYERWRNVFRTEKLNVELDLELQHHLAETADQLCASGMTEKEAMREARRRLGSYCLQKERTHDMDVAGWLESIRADLAYGIRQLRLNPGFASVAILSLALGIGANTAMFQLINAVRLKELPVMDPQELVSIDFAPDSARGGWWSSRSANYAYAHWLEMRKQQQAFSGLLAWSAARFNLVTGGEPRFAEGIYVSGGYFQELGVNASIGRTLTEADDSAACDMGAVISDAFWQREFGGDLGVLGRTLSLDGHPVPVIGVTPPSFFGVEVGSQYDVAVPLCADLVMKKGRIPGAANWWLSMMGRLKPGWTQEKATAHLHAISPGFMQATLPPDYNADIAKRYLENKLEANEAGTGVSGLRRQYEGPLLLLWIITGLVLLIACANLANLLLARASVREGEIAVRMAIGSSRLRLVRQLLTESMILAIAGAVLGAGFAVMLARGLVAFISSPNNRIFIDVSLDWRVVAFTGALAVLTCGLFGLLPALRATYPSPVAAMRSDGKSASAGRERFGVRNMLVVTQVAMSLVLLVGALLFIRSLNNLLTTDPGFKPAGVMLASINFSQVPYPEERRLDVYRDLRDRLAALPGVLSLAQVRFTPVGGGGWDNRVGADTTPAAASDKEANFNRTAPGYFNTMGTRLIAGRDFSERDTLHSPKVAIVNEMFAQKVFDGENPVGRTFHLEAGAGQQEQLFQIVGLVANTKYRQLREEFVPIGYFPIDQDEQPVEGANFVIRMAGSPGRLIAGAKATLEEMAPAISIQFQPFSKRLEDSILREQLVATLSGGFGLLAGLLAMLGLYGVIAYTVERRRSEFGVRMALGANPSHVVQLVLSEATLLVGIGLVVGIGISLWAGKAASSLLFGIEAHDLLTILAASAALATISLLASYLPARRAAALNPITSLRSE